MAEVRTARKEQIFPAFALCACGMHGRIEYGDGRIDAEVYTQKLAWRIYNQAVHDGRFPWRRGLLGQLKNLAVVFVLGFEMGIGGLPANENDLRVKHIDTTGIWRWNEALLALNFRPRDPLKCYAIALPPMPERPLLPSRTPS